MLRNSGKAYTAAKNIVHREQYMRAHSSVALLSLAHQGCPREGPQANHLSCDGSECYPLPCQYLDLDLPMLVSSNKYLCGGLDSDHA